jgi:hypothetical protein
VITHVPLGGEQSEHGVHLQGYGSLSGRDGVVSNHSAKLQPASAWQNLPPSNAPPMEITFGIGASSLFGLFFDDPSQPQQGYDTLLIAAARDGRAAITRLKATPPGPGTDLLWSQPIPVKTDRNHDATAYLRLFDLKPDGSDYLLYFTRPARETISRSESMTGSSAMARAFIGNGAHQLYNRGAFGPTIPKGGDGVAEARYLETVALVQRQLMESNRWVMRTRPWDLIFAYTPFPDEAEHLWRGYLDPNVPGYRQEIADRLRPFLARVYESSDELLGLFMANRPEHTIVALVSDHGMEGTNKLFAINKLLQQASLLAVNDKRQVDLEKTKAFYPSINNGYLLINSTERKNGIVGPEERAPLVRKITELLFDARDGDGRVVTAVYDGENNGDGLAIWTSRLATISTPA